MSVVKLHEFGPGNFDDACRVLDEVKADKPDRVLVLYEADGEYCSNTNIADGGTALWLLEWAKLKLMKSGTSDVWTL